MTILLVAVMVLGSFSAVFADVHEDNSITITSADEGTHKYTAYQIVVGDVTKEDGDYIYANAVWGSDVTPAEGKVDGRTPDEFLKYWKDNSTTVTKEQLADLVKTYVTGAGKSATGKVATISGLKDGFYIIVDTTETMGDNMARTDYILISVTGGEAREVNAKADVPKFEKKVQENVKAQNLTSKSDVTNLNYEAGYNDVADYSIGDTVPFLLQTKIVNTSAFKLYNIMFEDTMDPGLTYDKESFKVYVNGAEYTGSYDVTHNADGFKVIIPVKTYNATTKTSTDVLKKDDVVVIKYEALLNENAKIGNAKGNLNTASFKFTNDPNKDSESEPEGTTPDDEVIVFTYEVDINKFDGADNTKKLDAEFVLKALTGEHAGKYVKIDANGKVCGWTDSKTDEAAVLKTGDNGLCQIIGLDDGTYELEETKAPTGYNKLSDVITVEVKAGKTAAYDFGTHTWNDKNPASVVDTLKDGTIATGIVPEDVANNKGSTLPETGGIGTTILYTLGGILVVGAGVLLVARRKMER